MIVNGHLKFHTLGAGELQNAVMENLGSTARGNLPNVAGQLVFDTDLTAYYYNDGTQWVEFSTGGGLGGLQIEVDAIETASGGIFDTDGTYVPAIMDAFDNVSGSTSMANALSQMDAAIAGSDSLEELTDTVATTTSAAIDGDLLAFNGTNWDNTGFVTLTANDLLQWNGTDWVNIVPSSIGGNAYETFVTDVGTSIVADTIADTASLLGATNGGIQTTAALDAVTFDLTPTDLATTSATLVGADFLIVSDSGDASTVTAQKTTLTKVIQDLDIVTAAADGILTRTAADTYASRTITASVVAGDEGISIVDGNGVSGDPTVGLDIVGLTAGSAVAEVTDITTVDTSALTTGDYWTLSSPTVDYYVWYNKDSGGSDPAPGGTGIEVAVVSANAALAVAIATAAAINGIGAFTVPVPTTSTLTVTNAVGGDATDAADSNTTFTISVTTQGIDIVSATDLFTVYDGTNNVKINVTQLNDALVAVGNSLDDLTDVTITAAANNEFLVFTGSEWEDTTAADARIAMDVYSIAAADANFVDISGDTMNPGANLVFTGSGEVFGLPATPSTTTSAASKAYVDAQAGGVSWMQPVWYVDLVRDDVGAGQTGITLIRDLQTPANDTGEIAGAETSDMYIIGATATTISLTAVGVTGNSDTSAAFSAGTVVRFNSDIDNGGLDPVWEDKGHITTYYEEATMGAHSGSTTRWGVGTITGVTAGGTFAGLEDLVVGLVNYDPDGNGTADYDALWGIDYAQGAFETQTVQRVADVAGSLGGKYFTVNAAVGNGGTFDSKFHVWYNTGGSSDPAVASSIGIEVVITSGDSAIVVATKTETAIDAFWLGSLWTVDRITDTLTLTDLHYGNVTAVDVGDSGFSVATTVAGSLTATPVEGDAFYISNPDSLNFGKQFVYVAGTTNDWVEFGASATISDGVGLSLVGNVMHVNLGAGISELPTDEVGVDIWTAGGLFTTTDGTTLSTASSAQLAINLDGTTLALSSSGLKVSSGGITAVELNASVAGDGLEGGGGTALSIDIKSGSGLAITSNELDLVSIPNSALANSGVTVAGDSGSDAVALGETLTFTGGTGIDTAVTANEVTVTLNSVIDNLSDVDTTTVAPSNGDALIWDG